MALVFTDSNFEKEVIESEVPVLVDFWAEWCGPCRVIGPIVDQLGQEFVGQIKTGKLDVDSNDGVSTKFGIRNIPTILFFKQGKVVDKVVGAVSKNVLAERIRKVIG